MENYIRLSFSRNDEGLMAMLSLQPFESFVEEEDGMQAYLSEDNWTLECQNFVSDMARHFNVTFTEELILPKNWNEEWESNFHPVAVDDFCCIRADFHEVSIGFRHDIVINPKMAFGTGHHETTYMMISAMRNLNFQNVVVLDYGCGTGVLAILASKLGSIRNDAVDIEYPSYDNTVENARINDALNVNAIHGDIQSVVGNEYDIVLANINRNVLLDTAQETAGLVKTKGMLLLSGILKSDVDLISATYAKLGFLNKTKDERGNWAALLFEKTR